MRVLHMHPPRDVRALLVARDPSPKGESHASSVNPAGRVVEGSRFTRRRITKRPRRAAEEIARANTDAVFESACRFIVMKSLPG
jgi:hypothetical protein